MSCLSRQLKRTKVKINRVFGILSEPMENQNRTCPVKSLFQVQMNRLPLQRTYSESTALPNSLGVSSGSGLKRAYGESIVNDNEEQPGTRARISALIAGLNGVDAAEDDEMCSG